MGMASGFTWTLACSMLPRAGGEAGGRLGAQGAPETFRRLGKAESQMRAAMGGNLGALQCTHPRSETRVQMLEEELQLMQEQGELGLSKVMHSIPYWCACAPIVLPRAAEGALHWSQPCCVLLPGTMVGGVGGEGIAHKEGQLS